MIRIAMGVVLFLTLTTFTIAQDAKKDGEETPIITRHSVEIENAKVEYEAIAGRLPLRDDDGKLRAHLSFVYYRRTGVESSQRPIMFTFNGGPGSSSVWLHMGAFGPKRTKLTDNGEAIRPPFQLGANPYSLLDATDLVFIDPVGTGYSRAADAKEAKQFYGVQEDISSVGDFIAQFTTRYDRWSSPKFIAGESYGTTRAAGLSGYLQDRHGLDVNGIVLISSVLQFSTVRFEEGNDLPYILFLPSYTATAWYHKKLAPDLQADLRKTLDQVEKFAEGAYANALMKGAKLSAAEQAEIIKQLARFTGLSEDYVRQSNMRIEMSRFAKELLREQQITIGRFDSRIKGRDLDSAGERYEYDPSYSAIQGPYTAALQQYLRNDLGYKSDLNYEILTGKVQPWNYGSAQNRYLNVAPTLRTAMNKNRSLKVYIASGYYDLATPYFATDYTMNHLGIAPDLRKNVKVSYYQGGHMMYTIVGEHAKLRREMVEFIRDTLAP